MIIDNHHSIKVSCDDEHELMPIYNLNRHELCDRFYLGLR